MLIGGKAEYSRFVASFCSCVFLASFGVVEDDEGVDDDDDDEEEEGTSCAGLFTFADKTLLQQKNRRDERSGRTTEEQEAPL